MKTETPNLQQEMQRLVVAAPSSSKLAEATAKLESLRLQRSGVSAEVAALEKEATVESAERVSALLREGKTPQFVTSDELRQARRNMGVINDALLIQEREVRQLVASLSIEVRRNLKQFRQPLVARAAMALKALEAVRREEGEIVSAAGRAGADTNFLGHLQIPEPFGWEAWLSATRTAGYEI